MHLFPALALLAAASSPSAAIYVPIREYSGNTFFDTWDFWGNIDNTTWGNVTYLNKTTAMTQRLAYVDDDNGHAIIRVDNTTNIPSAPVVNRPSVRITSQDAYGAGDLVIIDVAHVPTGCSVWPSFWTLGVGKEWPHAGEIDIIEGINLQTSNQMAMHSDPGCMQAPQPGQTGLTLNTDCGSADGRGCIVGETKHNSFGAGFNKAGGGVFATQLDVSGVYIWFWGRADIPEQITTATSTSNINVTAFGLPSAAYPVSGCNYTQFFGPQQLVILTTLCGVWAGVPNTYAQTCPGTCISNVIGSGSPAYDEAYWDIAYIRTYFAQDQASLSSSSSSPSAAAAAMSATGNTSPTSASEASSASIASTAPTTENSTGTQGNGALRVGKTLLLQGLLTIISVFSLLTGLF
ncbi:putative glycosidase C21B10.07 [Termitomyces sp. J132]|nr:putative glycosidase C21B10.07 [Termitomyces sp. J132]